MSDLPLGSKYVNFKRAIEEILEISKKEPSKALALGFAVSQELEQSSELTEHGRDELSKGLSHVLDSAHFQDAFNALASWLHGHEMKGRTPIEALKSLERWLPSYPDTPEDFRVKTRTFIAAVRERLNLPRALGIYSVEDANNALQVYRDGGEISLRPEEASEVANELERYIDENSGTPEENAKKIELRKLREKSPALAAMADGSLAKMLSAQDQIVETLKPLSSDSRKRVLTEISDRFEKNTLKDTLGDDIKRNLTGIYSGQSAMDHLERLARDLEKRDDALQSIKDDCHGRVYFEKFIEICGGDPKFQNLMARNRHWVVSTEVGMTHAQVIAGRPKMIGEAHPFFISGKMIEKLENREAPELGGETAAEIQTKELPIDQPFKTVWVERSDGGPLFCLNSSRGQAWILGALVHEENASSYFAETLMAEKHGSRIVYFLYTTKLTQATAFGRMMKDGKATQMFNEGTMIQTATHDVVYWIFKSFRKDCAFTHEKVKPIRARVGTGKDRTAVKINRIVRVMLKAERKDYERTVGKKVEWTHKWEVMGHWAHFWSDKAMRKINMDRIGKDRDGNYVERGRTWVIDHVKGPDGKELIKKSRVVTDDLESGDHA